MGKKKDVKREKDDEKSVEWKRKERRLERDEKKK